jgi:hypothetical protein
MTTQDKLIDRALANPQKIRFNDACRIAKSLGFNHDSGRGSHRVFKRPGERVQLNFQDRNGYIPPYQGRQLVAMILRYRSNP